MRRWTAFVLAVGVMALGVWLSAGLGMPQLLLFGAGLMGLVGVCAETFLDHPGSPELRTHRQAFILWSAPGLLVAAGLWVAHLLPGEYLAAVAAAAAATTLVLLLSLGIGLRPDARRYRVGRFVANLILYLVVFLLYALIYHTKERSLFTATSIGLVTLVAALEILRPARGTQAAGLGLPVLAALIVAEVTWALNYWLVGGVVGGALLLLTFYVFSGLLLAIQEGGIDRRIVVEYGIVGTVGLAAIMWAMP